MVRVLAWGFRIWGFVGSGSLVGASDFLGFIRV